MKRGLFGGGAPAAASQAAARVLSDLQQGYGGAYATPGLLMAGNIDLRNRPQHINRDGSVSTVRSMGIGVDGREYVIPTVRDDGELMSDDEAVQAFIGTGRHLGGFTTPEAATAWAQRLHDEQAAALAERQAAR